VSLAAGAAAEILCLSIVFRPQRPLQNPARAAPGRQLGNPCSYRNPMLRLCHNLTRRGGRLPVGDDPPSSLQDPAGSQPRPADAAPEARRGEEMGVQLGAPPEDRGLREERKEPRRPGAPPGAQPAEEGGGVRGRSALDV